MSLLYYVSVVVLLFFCFYHFATSTYSYWADRNVPHLKPIPLFGNFGGVLTVRKSFAETLKTLYEAFPNEPFMGIYQARRPSILLRDPELIKEILIKDFSHFVDRTSVTTDTKREPLLRNLSNMSGDEWKAFRHKVTPIFSSAKIKAMFPLIAECAGQLIESVEINVKAGEPIDIAELMACYTTDVIASCAFGIHTSSLQDPNSPFRKMGKEIFASKKSTVLKRYCRIYFPSLYKLLNLKTYSNEIENFFSSVVEQVLTERRKSKVTRNDFVEMMMGLCDSETVENDFSDVSKVRMTDDLIASNSFIFLLAGLETSSTTLTFCLYELAQNPDTLQAAQESVDRAYAEFGELNYDAVNSLGYLGRAIWETMRKHPATPVTSRLCNKAYRIPRSHVELRPGDVVIVPIYAVHRDPQHYPLPERFDPDRFTDEGKSSRHSCTFLTLGEGPRNCLGSRFAQIMMLAGLATLLRRYKLVICDKTTPTIEYDPRSVLLKNKEGIWLKLEPRMI